MEILSPTTITQQKRKKSKGPKKNPLYLELSFVNQKDSKKNQ